MRNNQVYAQLLLPVWLDDPIRATKLSHTRNNTPYAQAKSRSAQPVAEIVQRGSWQATERTRLTPYSSARIAQVGPVPAHAYGLASSALPSDDGYRRVPKSTGRRSPLLRQIGIERGGCRRIVVRGSARERRRATAQSARSASSGSIRDARID